MNNMKRLAILIAVLLSLPSLAAAQKRRSVGMPEVDSNAPVTVICKGTVTDAATGLPVAYAEITAVKGPHGFASRTGKFSFSVVTTSGDVNITAGRTGYDSVAVKVSGAGTHEVNFRLQSRPTATLQKIDGTTVALDDDSVKFGYIVPFMGYQTATGNDFCSTDGTQGRIPMAQITRITGLGTSGPSSCCQRPAQRALLELRDGTIHDATFIDSCYAYSVDLIGRDHATGDPVYVPFNEVSEIVFP
jgi:hypothetical protein